MDKDIRKYLYDIVVAIEEVESYFEGRSKCYEELLSET